VQHPTSPHNRQVSGTVESGVMRRRKVARSAVSGKSLARALGGPLWLERPRHRPDSPRPTRVTKVNSDCCQERTAHTPSTSSATPQQLGPPVAHLGPARAPNRCDAAAPLPGSCAQASTPEAEARHRGNSKWPIPTMDRLAPC
jgi:hypothetical protein